MPPEALAPTWQPVWAAFVPEVDCQEAALVEGIQVYPVPDLASLIGHLRGEEPIAPLTGSGIVPVDTRPLPDGINCPS